MNGAAWNMHSTLLKALTQCMQTDFLSRCLHRCQGFNDRRASQIREEMPRKSFIHRLRMVYQAIQLQRERGWTCPFVVKQLIGA